MTERPGIEQFEYRWQPAKDLSLIAGSQPAAAIQPWSDRIALWVRHRAVEAPTASVRYEIFSDGMAAFAWRQRNTQDMKSGDGTEGRPEVSRVLMGPCQLLTPGVAMALCRTGLPDAIGPPPGAIAIGSPLPTVDAAELTSLARANLDKLDQLAMNQTGLYRVVAAAMTDCDAPLAVQLPQRVIARAPQDGPQGPLLWGLRRIMWPLLGNDSGRRGWSFSTYEPPLGDVGTGALADIVFRAHQAVQSALSSRREILVRPQDPTEAPARILHQDFARLLVDAYRYLGPDRLYRHLDAVGGEYSSLDERIESVQETLYAALPPEALSVSQSRSVSAVPATWQESEDFPPADAMAPWPDATLRPDMAPLEDVAPQPDVAPLEDTPALRAAPPPPVPPRPPVPPAPSETAPPLAPSETAPPPTTPPWAGPLPSATPPLWTPEPEPPPLRGASRVREDAPPRDGGRPEPAEAVVPYTVSSLLDQLCAGPEGPGFERALHLLRTGTFADRPGDRAVARRLFAERDWYLPALGSYDSVHFYDTLEAIFRLAVIPDLGRPMVTEELARWAGEQAAPPPVIQALHAAAQSRPKGPELMREALEAPLGRRWLAEHGISIDPSAYPAAGAAPRRGAHVAGSPHSQWALLESRLRGDPVTLLSLFCAVLIALLVVSVWY